MNQLDAMHIFVRVAELSSFTRAAEALDLPKASVSTAVQQLETMLGTRLLQRTTRRVALTHDGRAFYERCKDLLADMDELQSMFEQSPRSLRGRLRVDMPSGTARLHVLPQLPAFLAEHPQLAIELSSTDRRVDVLREGFDCVLRVGLPAEPNLIARPLGRLRMINCASPAYLREHGTPRTLDDLAAHRLVHYVPTWGAKPFGFEYPDGSGGYANLPMEGALSVNSAEAYEAACLAGLGIIQVPAAGVARHLAQQSLVEVLPDLRAESMPVVLVYPHRRHLPRRVQVFMQWLGEVVAPILERD